MAKHKTVSRLSAADRVQRLNDQMAESFKAQGRTQDSFQNFALNLGMGTDNALSGSTYGFNPITLVRTLLEWIYRGSWLGGAAVDLVADDMTRAGIEYHTTMPPEDIERMQAASVELNLFGSWNEAIKWGRLYGGAGLVPLVDGQDPSTPLRLNTIGKGQLKGFLVLDRWMVEPSMERLVADYGPHMGLPMFYRVTADAPGLNRKTIHYSRFMRCEGVALPYWQKLGNNLWGMSVIERLYDRMIAFDSATQGAAQLVYKSFLRTLKLEGLREAIIAGGDAMKGVVDQVNTMRRFQGIEGISLLDAEDEMNVEDHGSFSGIAEALGQFAQQISGALQIPLVRLFGQSPTGFNSGDADVRTYYDGINHQQELKRVPITMMLMMIAKSEGIALPDNFGFKFRSLWQLDDIQKAEVANKTGQTVSQAVNDGTIGRKTALKELRQASAITGVFSNITDEDIESAEEDPPDMSELGMGGNVAGEGAEPNEKLNSEPTAAKGAKLNSESGARDSAGNVASLIDIYGLPVRIETFKGMIRRGQDKDGKPWGAVLAADYGYFEGTGSAEGAYEGMDCFIGPDWSAKQVFVIEQRHLDTRDFDEYKCMLGFGSPVAAKAAYAGSYHDGRGAERIMDTRVMSVAEFKTWLAGQNELSRVGVR